MKKPFALLLSLQIPLAAWTGACAQVVGVTAQLDASTINVGQGTTLRVFAQVLPGVRTNADQIFSWYVDVLNTNVAVASANYASMLKPASDNNPMVSSNGFTGGANRLGIYDTFLNLPRAGVTNAVELLRIPVRASGSAASISRPSMPTFSRPSMNASSPSIGHASAYRGGGSFGGSGAPRMSSGGGFRGGGGRSR